MPSRRQKLENHVARLRRCRRCPRVIPPPVSGGAIVSGVMVIGQAPGVREPTLKRDRKSTRLNSSHLGISYAVFCLKKKKKITRIIKSGVTHVNKDQHK